MSENVTNPATGHVRPLVTTGATDPPVDGLEARRAASSALRRVFFGGPAGGLLLLELLKHLVVFGLDSVQSGGELSAQSIQLCHHHLLFGHGLGEALQAASEIGFERSEVVHQRLVGLCDALQVGDARPTRPASPRWLRMFIREVVAWIYRLAARNLDRAWVVSCLRRSFLA